MAEITYKDVPVRVEVGGIPQTLNDAHIARVIVDQVGVEHLVGPAGRDGAPGARGETGTAGGPGPRGDTGLTGRDGATGRDGRTIHPTTGRPSNGVGADGDLAYDVTASMVYGPKTAGVWPAGTSLVGPRGDTGDVGPRGDTGDVGPRGSTGDAGPRGDQGPAGRDGLGVPAGGASGDVLCKSSGVDNDTNWGKTGGGNISDAAIQRRHAHDELRPSLSGIDTAETLRALGTGRGQAAPGANAVGRVAHGATAGTARPTGYALVVWIGSVEPTLRVAGDLWIRTS